MNEYNGEILDSFDRLSLNSLSKSSPSTFSMKPSRLLQQPPLPTSSLNNSKSSNLSHVPCKFYKQGTCTAGSNCIFSHNLDPTSESSVCKYFRKGNCKFGTKCALLHTMSPYNNTNNNNSNTASSYTDPFAMSSSPFSLHDDVDNFILPSSLNDLLTPTELRKQQVPNYLSSSTSSHHRQPSYEPTSSSWNVPFYSSTDRYFPNAINIPNNNARNYQQHMHFQHDFLPSNNTLFEEDGPFIMEDTNCIDNSFKTT